MANQELFKLENSVRKAEGAWDRQMKRDGHLKKESRDISTAEPQHMSATARAFYHEYVASKSLLDAEAVRADVLGGSAADPAAGSHDGADKGKGKKGGHLTVVEHSYPNPDDVAVPDGMEKVVVDPALLSDFKELSAAESLQKDKPTAKVVPLNDQHWVVVEVAENYAVLNRCVPEDQYDQGDTIANLDGREAGDWAGLLFRSGSGRSPMFVLLNAAQSIAAVAGDPAAGIGLAGAVNG